MKCRWADAHQGEKGKKRWKDALTDVFALVNQWYGKSIIISEKQMGKRAGDYADDPDH